MPESMLDSDGNVTAGTKYDVNLTICNGWNEVPNTISKPKDSEGHVKDYFDPNKISPVLFGDLGGMQVKKHEKIGKEKVLINRPAVATFIGD